MNKKLKSLAVVVGIIVGSIGISHAATAGDTEIQQRDPTNAFNILNFIPLPAGPAALSIDTATNAIGYAVYGSGLNFGAGALSVANVPESSVTNLVGDLTSKLTAPLGSTAQYIRGDGTLATLPVPATRSFNNAASHTIVTTAAAANGFQLSSTQDTSVFYTVNVNTTATIAGNADGYVALEIAPTNSTLASDWKEIARARNGQSISLAITLQSVQNISSEVMGIVPTGYYARLRSVNVSGTPVYTFVSGQEVQI